MTASSNGAAVPPSLASAASLHYRSTWPGGAELMGMLQPLQCLLHCCTFGTRICSGGVSYALMTSSFEFLPVFVLLEPNQS